MDQAQSLVDALVVYGLQVLGAVIILVLGGLVAGWAARWLRKMLSRSGRLDETLTAFLVSLVRYVILAFVVIAVLNQFGVQTTSLIALLGAAGLAIGLAMQGTLSNVAAGVMLLIFRPFKIGQYVEVGGRAGTVKELNLFVTELATPDNVQIIIPNSSVWGSAVVNYSHHATRRADFTLGIAYSDDIGHAMDIIGRVLAQEQRLLEEPQPQVVVGALADSAVEIIVRVWVGADDYWPVKFDLIRALKEALEQGGVTIPFPQRDVHLYQTAATGTAQQ